MGRILQHLAETNIDTKTIFDRRMVLECCETFHLHWRNLRLEFNHENFLKFIETVISAFKNWQANGLPRQHAHFEMGRNLLSHPMCAPDEFKIERCDNLYKQHRGSRDAEFFEDDFIHIHYRDLRMEMPRDEFLEIAERFREAKENLGHKSKQSLSELFDVLDRNNIIYVVMRDWDHLPDNVILGPQSDIDLLVHPLHIGKVKELWRLEPTHTEPYRVEFKCLLNNESDNYFLCDLRTTTDGYYPENFANKMLNSRIKHKNFYILPPDVHFYSLLYHAIYHKGVVYPSHLNDLIRQSRVAGIPFDSNSFTDLSSLSHILDERNIRYVQPLDPSTLPALPFLSEVKNVIYSNHLSNYNGVKILSRIYKKNDNDKLTIIKQTTFDLAKGEFDILSKFNSRYFPKVYKGEHKDTYSMFEMEFIDGYMLSDLMGHADEWDKKKTDRFIRGCISILEELKLKNIFHRDILPNNIIIRNHEPVLIDFGWSITKGEKFLTPDGIGAWARPSNGSFSDAYSMGVSLFGFGVLFPEYYPVIKKLIDSVGFGAGINYKSLKKRLSSATDTDGQNNYPKKINNLIQTVIENNPAYSHVIYGYTGVEKLAGLKELSDPVLVSEASDEENKKDIKAKESEKIIIKKEIMVSIILMMSDQSEFSGEWLDILKENTHKGSYELIVVRNRSLSGDTVEIPDSFKDCIRVIDNGNVYFAEGFNKGISLAQGRYIVLPENNVIVSKHWLDNVVSRMGNKKNAGMVVPMITGCESGFEACMIERKGYPVNFPMDDPGIAGQIQHLVNLCAVFRKDMFDVIGNMDEKYRCKELAVIDCCIKAMVADYEIIATDGIISLKDNERILNGCADSPNIDTRNDLKYFTEKWDDFIKQEGRIFNINMSEEKKRNKLVQWGEERMAVGNSHSAAQIFKRVYRFIKDDYKALNNLGVVQWQLGEKESAINSFQTAVKINPNDKDSVSNFLQAAKEEGRIDLISSTLPVIERQLNSVA